MLSISVQAGWDASRCLLPCFLLHVLPDRVFTSGSDTNHSYFPIKLLKNFNTWICFANLASLFFTKVLSGICKLFQLSVEAALFWVPIFTWKVTVFTFIIALSEVQKVQTLTSVGKM